MYGAFTFLLASEILNPDMVIRQDYSDFPVQRSTLIASLIVGLVILCVKFGAYVLTNSTAILSDALESIANVMTAAIALACLIASKKPADEKHPYGHGKMEFFSAAFEGGAILLAALLIIYRSIDQMVAGVDVHSLDIGLFLVGGAAVSNGLMGLIIYKRGKKTESIVLEAEGRHLFTDVFTSAGVIVGLIVVYVTGWQILDPIISIAVAFNITYVGYKLLKQSAQGMMDVACDGDEKIVEEVLSDPAWNEICGYHKLRCRHSGQFHFVDFHLLISAGRRIDEAHKIASEVESAVAKRLKNASVIAHVEPCRSPDCKKRRN